MVCDNPVLILGLFLVLPFSSIANGSALADLLENIESHCLYLFWFPREPLGALERPRLFPRSGREPRL